MPDGVIGLTVNFTAAPGTQTTATLERGLSATGPWEFIRTVELLGQVGYTYDTTAPLDTPLWYRWTGDPGGDEIIQGPFTEVGAGTVLIKDPLRPWANLEFFFCASQQQALAAICTPGGPDLVWVGFAEETFRSDANMFDVYDARTPDDIFGVRKDRDGSLRLFSKTLAARDAVKTLFAAGGPLQLQLPAEYGWDDSLVQPFDLVSSYIAPDQRLPYRAWSAQWTRVLTPEGPIQGTACANWCAVSDAYPLFSNLTASGLTWGQVAAGAAGGAGC